MFGRNRAGNHVENRVNNLARNRRHVTSPRNGYEWHAQRFLQAVQTVGGQAGVAGRVVSHSRGPRYCSLGLRLQDSLQLDKAIGLAENMAIFAGARMAVAARRPEAPGLITYQFELPDSLWATYTRRDLATMHRLAIGITEANRPELFKFDSPHAGVFGTTGAGKTVAVRTIVHALASANDPDALQLVIVDSERDMADFRRLQHLALPIADTPERIDYALDWVSAELAHRIEHNVRGGPSLVVVIDEAEDVLANERRFAIVERVGKRARKRGIHLVVATQKPSQTKLPDLLPNILNRYVGLVDNARVSADLTGHAGVNCHLLTGRGDFMHVEGQHLARVQVAMTTPQDLAALPWGEEPPLPAIDHPDAPAVTNLPDVDERGGRPPNELQADLLAWYLAASAEGKRISIRMAREERGISRGLHDMHKPFAAEVATELERLGYGIGNE